ncbi:unnamed protein product [Chrysodeixis includens]|uniref:Uncharacterized protein n=1 Tax=Chrysodeixis includens TaxID=689277 RepID=A0A9N8KV50_CHRIL|nr:unnamed protein product [Chrysodeixis includens]
MTPLGPTAPPLAHPAMAFGFMVVANACAFGPVSGAHMNPAVTLAALLYGQLDALPALGYVLAQMLGATLGFGALQATSPSAATLPPVGVTQPGPGVSALAAVLVEAVLTGTLALALCGVWATHDATRPDPSVPIKLGLVVAGLVYAGGYATGASINPARSFGPALLQGTWDYQWVYWVGPLGGAALATLAHRYVLLPRARRLPDRDDVALPLNDKTEP